MIKFRKLPENILQLLPGAFEYLESHPTVIFSYLFGSLSKGKPSPLSDVDIAVFLKKAEKVADRKIEILGRLIEILETDEIDLVVLNTADLPLVMGILKNKKLIERRRAIFIFWQPWALRRVPCAFNLQPSTSYETA